MLNEGGWVIIFKVPPYWAVSPEVVVVVIVGVVTVWVVEVVAVVLVAVEVVVVDVADVVDEAEVVEVVVPLLQALKKDIPIMAISRQILIHNIKGLLTLIWHLLFLGDSMAL